MKAVGFLSQRSMIGCSDLKCQGVMYETKNPAGMLELTANSWCLR
ncbi:MAG: hypothetical protein RLZZ09_2744 [Pseudomonadota bacterium]|jgi:hypothetical protein